MSFTMARDTTVQFRLDSTVKDDAFAVFKEMGITPSEAVRVFFKQVQKTRTLPFIISADDEANVNPEAGYAEWLKARLKSTIEKLDSGEMKSYPKEEAKVLLASRLEARRKSLKAAT
jgi:addiction module RelB/DinJ family antitoxin